MKIIHIKISLLMTALFFVACSSQDQFVSAREKKNIFSKPQEIRLSQTGVSAGQPAIAKDKKGEVYTIWVEHDANKRANIFLQKFDLTGNAIGERVRVNSKNGMATAWRGDPPTIKVGNDNSVFVGWTGRSNDGAEKHATDVYLSVSANGGNNFNEPVKVNDDDLSVSHGLHSLGVDGDRVYLAWLDDRNMKPEHGDSKESKHDSEPNRELYFAVSKDGGKTFSANKKIASDVCPCCKTDIAVASNGRVYIGWRQVIGEDLRHIAITSTEDHGETFAARTIVSDDKWQFNGCPVSGPNLNVTSKGKLQVVWYTAGEAGPKGLYLAESKNGGITFGERRNIVEGTILSTPSLVQDDKNTFVLWEGINEDFAGTMLKPIRQTADDKLLKEEVLIQDGSLPTSILSNKRIFTAHVREENKRQGVWMSYVKTH